MSDADRGEGAPHRTGSNGQAGALSVSKLCDLLASDRRRIVLRYLAEREGEVVFVGELADHLVATGNAEKRHNCVISLEHVHLPKLSKTGVITYDRDRRRLRYRTPRELEKLRTFIEEEF